MMAASEAVSRLLKYFIAILRLLLFGGQKVVLNEAVTMPRSLSSGARPACEVICPGMHW
ncbi:hypothetical protein D3C80_2200710 [compost metagenome]